MCGLSPSTIHRRFESSDSDRRSFARRRRRQVHAERQCPAGGHVAASTSTRSIAAFSLVELVMVIAIIGIVAAIAVPRITQASRSAKANALLATLENVRAAIDHYNAEHGKYPGYNPSTSAPSGTWFIDQLTKYSDARGNVADLPTSQYQYGPYLRKPFPTNPLNSLSDVRVRASSSEVIATGVSGWIASLDDGTFDVNLSETDLEFIGVRVEEVVSIGGGPAGKLAGELGGG